MALQLTIPLSNTGVNGVVHRVASVTVNFNANGTVSPGGVQIGIQSFIDNVVAGSVAGDSIKASITNPMAAQILAIAYARLLADAKYSGAQTIADPS